MGCSVCPLPDIVRRPWTVFRDFVREAASELADVPRVDGANLLSLSQEHCETMLSVGPVVAYPFALASLTEAASFIQYVQTPQDVGKKACFASLSSEQKGDFVPTDIQSFLHCRKPGTTSCKLVGLALFCLGCSMQSHSRCKCITSTRLRETWFVACWSTYLRAFKDPGRASEQH